MPLSFLKPEFIDHIPSLRNAFIHFVLNLSIDLLFMVSSIPRLGRTSQRATCWKASIAKNKGSQENSNKSGRYVCRSVIFRVSNNRKYGTSIACWPGSWQISRLLGMLLPSYWHLEWPVWFLRPLEHAMSTRGCEHLVQSFMVMWSGHALESPRVDEGVNKP